MRNLILISTLFFAAILCAQQHASSDSLRIRRLVTKAEALARTDSQEGIALCRKALQLSQKLKYNRLDNFACNVLGRIYAAEGSVGQSAYFLKKAIALSQRYDDKAMLCASYCDLGSLMVFESKHLAAIDYFNKSLKIAEQTHDVALSFFNLYYLSDLYFSEHNTTRSFEYAFKALRQLKNQGPDFDYQRGAIYDQIGKTYWLQKDYKNAKLYLTKSLAYYEKINEPLGIANATYDLARNEYQLDPSVSIEALIVQASMANQKFNATAPDSRNNINCLNFLAELELKQFDLHKKPSALDKALGYAKKAHSLCAQAGFVSAAIDNYKLLSEIYSKKGDYRSAYQSHEIFYRLNDSLFSQEHKNELAKMEARKDLIIKDNQLKIKSMQIASQRKQKGLLVAGLLLLTVIGVVLWHENRNRNRRNHRLQRLNQELQDANSVKTRFVNIINHDLRSPVSNLIDFLHLQKDSPDLLDASTKDRISKTTLTAAENLLKSMEDLLLWSKSQMENFKPQPETIQIAAIFSDIQKHFESEERVAIAFENPEHIQLHTDANYLKTIIRNLTGNAIKALEQTKQPIIVWKAWREKKQIILEITDNGPGADDAQFKALYDDREVVGIGTGLGLHLIRDLSKAIDGEIKVRSVLGSGTTFTLVFTTAE